MENQSSSSIGKLAEALAKAQGQMSNANKDSVNPHFKNRYADLAAVLDAVRAPLSTNGLAYTQFVEEEEMVDKNNKLYLRTILMHSSGEFISSLTPLILVKQDMQALGSAITYAKRYSLSAMVGITHDDEKDDDGNEASKKHDNIPPPQIWKLTQADLTKFTDSIKHKGYTKQDFVVLLKGRDFFKLTQREFEDDLLLPTKDPKGLKEFEDEASKLGPISGGK